MGDKIKLLYAEDNPGWASMIKEILEQKEFRVEIAADGDQAWEKFMREQPDMILLDIDMPGRNGWELISAFKKEKEWIPIVLYSAFYDSARLSEAFGLGAEDFISKTCVAEELIHRLQAFYTRAMNRRENSELYVISDFVCFNATSAILKVGDDKKILKQNEAKLLKLLCQKMNEEADKKYLCEGIWGKGMYNEAKSNALKIYITNLRKFLSADASVRIVNKRWGGYCLIR